MPKAQRHVPERLHSVTPQLFVSDARALKNDAFCEGA
jgi:hypothetical protein